MSFTGSGFDSSCSGGSFLGKKNSSSSRNSERYRGSSNCLSAINRRSSGSGPGGFGFIGWDPIIPSAEESMRLLKPFPSKDASSLEQMNATCYKLLRIQRNLYREKKVLAPTAP